MCINIIYVGFLGLGFQVKNLCVMFVFAIVSFMFFSEYQFAVDIVQGQNLQKDTQELEQMITKLKVQIEEDKRIEEALKEQLEGKDRIIGNLEAEIVTLRKDIQKKNMQNSSKVLDDIISSQKPHFDNSGLGYNQTKKGSNSKTTEQETNPKIYAETIKGDKNMYTEDYRDTPPLRRFIFQNQQQIDRPQEEEGFIRTPPFRRYSTPRYQTIFFGLCYACNNFGHKAVNCRANNRNINNFESHKKGLSKKAQ